MRKTTSAPRLFLCYARADTKWVERLRPHLLLLTKRNELSTFNDQQIPPGGEWDRVIRKELSQAHIVLVLVSIDLLVSEYVNSVELKTAMKRHDAGHVQIIPVIARECDWEDTLGRFQALPKDKGRIKPLDEWRGKRDQVLTHVAESVRSVAATMRDGQTTRAPRRTAKPARRARLRRSSEARPTLTATASSSGHADEMLDLALASSASLFERCQTQPFWVARLRQMITMTIRIDADWSVRYEKAMTMRVRGAGAIVAAPFRIAARAEAMARLGVFDVDARYQEVGAPQARQPLLFPTASHAQKGMEERAFTVVFTPPITAARERRFLLWFAVPGEFEDTLGKKESDVLGCLTLQLAHEHTVALRFEVQVSQKLPRLNLQPRFRCTTARPSVAASTADSYDQYVFTAPPVRVVDRLAQAIAVTVDSKAPRPYSTGRRRT